MTEELIKERHSSYAPHGALALENLLEAKENSLVREDRYSSTIASCKHFPPSIHAAKSLFVEPEQEVSAKPVQEQQQKLKESFLKRLTRANLKNSSLISKHTFMPFLLR